MAFWEFDNFFKCWRGKRMIKKRSTDSVVRFTPLDRGALELFPRTFGNVRRKIAWRASRWILPGD